MRKLIRRLATEKKGATAIEYGLILALIALSLVAGMSGVATKTSSMWNNVSTTVLAH
jgi:pilus assembly protein Flp/PilA